MGIIPFLCLILLFHTQAVTYGCEIVAKAVNDFSVDFREFPACTNTKNRALNCSAYGDNSDWGSLKKRTQVLLNDDIPKYVCMAKDPPRKKRALEESPQECPCLKDEKVVCDMNQQKKLGTMCEENIVNAYMMCSLQNEPICSKCCQDYFWDPSRLQCSKCGALSTTPGCGVYPSCSIPRHILPTSKPVAYVTDAIHRYTPVTSTSSKFSYISETFSNMSIQSILTEIVSPVHLKSPSHISVGFGSAKCRIKWRYNGKKSDKFLVTVRSGHGSNASMVVEKETFRRNLRLSNNKLQPDTFHTVTVVAFNHKGNGPARSLTFKTPKKQALYSFDYINAIITKNELTLEWNPSIQVDENPIIVFEVEYWKYQDRPSVQFLRTTDNRIKFLLPAGKYEVRVQAYIEDGLESGSETLVVVSDSDSADNGSRAMTLSSVLLALEALYYMVF